jgi:predicted polyphosphate/ATP-dependent NAD kinase
MNWGFRLSELCCLMILNPIAGLGGSVGLKGSDSPELQAEALRRGAQPLAQKRARGFLTALQHEVGADAVHWFANEQVAVLLRDCGFKKVEVLLRAQAEPNDTVALVAKYQQRVDCVVFVGGDGTARDVLSVCESSMPCLGVPAGVKMHSGVFAVSPQAAGKVMAQLVTGGMIAPNARAVRDWDGGEIVSYGEMRVPEAGGWIQQTKSAGRENETLAVDEIVAELQEQVLQQRPLVIGPGGTTYQIKSVLNSGATLRGFDIYTDAGCKLDATEDDLRKLPSSTQFVISFADVQGFLFGRGNQQMSANVLRDLDPHSQLIIVATRTKLNSLDGRPLLIDSGDIELDSRLAGLYEIVTGYEDRLLYRVGSASA